jgi:hypothetical protein
MRSVYLVVVAALLIGCETQQHPLIATQTLNLINI